MSSGLALCPGGEGLVGEAAEAYVHHGDAGSQGTAEAKHHRNPCAQQPAGQRRRGFPRWFAVHSSSCTWRRREWRGFPAYDDAARRGAGYGGDQGPGLGAGVCETWARDCHDLSRNTASNVVHLKTPGRKRGERESLTPWQVASRHSQETAS